MISSIINKISNLKDLPLLILRLVLAYGFYDPFMKKVANIGNIAAWFESINIPLPTLNAYLATATEGLGVILLTLGLFTRYISIPLMITMVVAIITVHGANGFSAGNNGFEIPFYYLVMLFTLLVYGSGKFSVDRFLNLK